MARLTTLERKILSVVKTKRIWLQSSPAQRRRYPRGRPAASWRDPIIWCCGDRRRALLGPDGTGEARRQPGRQTRAERQRRRRRGRGRWPGRGPRWGQRCWGGAVWAGVWGGDAGPHDRGCGAAGVGGGGGTVPGGGAEVEAEVLGEGGPREVVVAGMARARQRRAVTGVSGEPTAAETQAARAPSLTRAQQAQAAGAA